MKDKIAVIGAGFMGPGIAQVFATAGHPVHLSNRSSGKLTTVIDQVRSNLTAMAEYDLIDATEIPQILSRISLTTDLAEACSNASVVIETITESRQLKQDLFVQLDRLCPPETILCSNTSVISITQIGEKAGHPERIVGTHFYQPPYLVPLVEVTRTEHTLPQHMDAVVELMTACGKVPVRVQKDVPGFIANRMQHALWREAFSLIDEGICDAEAVDIAVSNSFGIRLPVLGPVANADLVGLDLTLAIHDYVLPHLSVSPDPSTTLRSRVAEGQLGFKTKSGFLTWTDEQMAATRKQVTTHLLRMLSQLKSNAMPVKD
ncbi:3-hydroxyacyl-CoA dehydrogenase family protein [Edaphobacter albus]|uniref:3-hydroxyacyl-CoA dehydrogenase family protein n=1 Tax=Edaphobacter sp. 4G125 TaxID=2763071 RepID=UPI001646B6BF|nr:3-hydroxyacyl-CoA dehydrogenase NAD-binding domain-containing protein [Edaphobacter sp. 4G125]QNI35830.1 NAD(P)-binding domain-containing protein [Edaphobacter sp. 4G125]